MDPQKPRRRALTAVFAATVVGLAGGFYLMWPYLDAGSSRLELWETVLLFSKDFLVLYWFVRYAVDHGVLGKKPLVDLRPEEFRGRGRRRMAMASIVLALAFDGAFLGRLISQEYQACNRALLTRGAIVSLNSRCDPEHRVIFYFGMYEFTDHQGRQHTGSYEVHEREGRHEDLPIEIQQALRAPLSLENGRPEARSPDEPWAIPIDVAFDPERPARNWGVGIGRLTDNAHVLVLFGVVLCVQSMVLIAFWGAVNDIERNHRRIPWWHELYKALPLIVEAFTFLLIALLLELKTRGWIHPL